MNHGVYKLPTTINRFFIEHLGYNIRNFVAEAQSKLVLQIYIR